MVLREIFVRHLKWQVTDAVSAEEVRAETILVCCVMICVVSGCLCESECAPFSTRQVIRRTVTDGEQY
eukprot:910028-Prymnesium_polylepis.1